MKADQKAAQQQQQQWYLIGAAKKRKYHLATCYLVRRAQEGTKSKENELTVITDTTGYEPCGICLRAKQQQQQQQTKPTNEETVSS
jgi:hypothetical protein